MFVGLPATLKRTVAMAMRDRVMGTVRLVRTVGLRVTVTVTV